MTEEFDIMTAFQQIRQQLHDTRQPRNIGLVVEALQEPRLVHDGFTVPPLPTDLDWTDVRVEPPRYWTEPELNLDEDEDEDEDDDNDEELINIMDPMAWAYLPAEIKDDICTNFYHGVRAIHQILLTIPDENQRGGMGITAATVEVKRDDFGTHLSLDGEVIAWYATNDPLEDEYSPIFFDYAYNKLGTFFLGAAQLLWGALGYKTYILDARYISDEEREPWEEIDDAELSAYTFHRIKQVRQLSGNFGIFKKKVRNARRRRNL